MMPPNDANILDFSPPETLPVVSLQTCPALVLNADYKPLSYFPLSVWPWQEAVKAVFLDRVETVSAYDHTVRSPSFEMRLPSVIALRSYIPLNKRPAFTRFNVFLRDRFSCQYCGLRFETRDLTFDHVIPRSRGGRGFMEQCRDGVPDLQHGERQQDGRARPGCSLSPDRLPQRPSSCAATDSPSRRTSFTSTGATTSTGTASSSRTDTLTSRPGRRTGNEMGRGPGEPGPPCHSLVDKRMARRVPRRMAPVRRVCAGASRAPCSRAVS